MNPEIPDSPRFRTVNNQDQFAVSFLARRGDPHGPLVCSVNWIAIDDLVGEAREDGANAARAAEMDAAAKCGRQGQWALDRIRRANDARARALMARQKERLLKRLEYLERADAWAAWGKEAGER
jgi:hypothetical protein